jgi:acetyl-CoA acyltransferase 1
LLTYSPLSQISDGAAAVLLARRSFAKQHGLPILGKFVAAQVAGVEPKLMVSPL